MLDRLDARAAHRDEGSMAAQWVALLPHPCGAEPPNHASAMCVWIIFSWCSVGFIWVLRFPPAGQRYSVRLIGISALNVVCLFVRGCLNLPCDGLASGLHPWSSLDKLQASL